MMLGGVTPFALPDRFPIYVDSRVMIMDYVILGGGTRSLKVKVAPAALAALPMAEIVERLAVDRS